MPHPSILRCALVSTALVLSVVETPALAGQTCKYVDAEGRVTFANVPVKNARKVMCFEPVPQPAPKQVVPAPRAPSDGAQAAAPARVDAPTQRRRDEDRRRILEQELSEEQRLLEAARRMLTRDGTSGNRSDPGVAQVLENLGPAYESAKRHERNIDAIQRELSAIR
jgi:hypothetical protein